MDPSIQKPKPGSSYPPFPPSPIRRPPFEGSYGAPAAHAAYEPSWRGHYPPPFDFPSHPNQRRGSSNSSQPPLTPHGCPVIPGRELPQLPDASPYGRAPNGLSAPTHTPPEGHPPGPHTHYRPINDTPHDSAPQTGPSNADYRLRMPYPEPQSSGDMPPGPHSMVPSQYGAVMRSHMSPAPYDAAYYNYSMRQRRAARAQQACDQCRARKAKCDEGRPSCSHCKENNLMCVYKEVPPHKQEKTTQIMLDRMQLIEDRIENRLDQIQQLQSENNLLLGRILPDDYNFKSKAVPTKLGMGERMSFTETSKTPSFEHSLKADDGDADTTTLEKAEPGDEGKIEGEGELSMPLEHTTAAHKLLLWPAIQHLLSPNTYHEDYVMTKEEGRGLFRAYGRGEDDESSEDPVLPASSPGGSLSPSFEEHHLASHRSPKMVLNSGSPRTSTVVVGVDEYGYLTADADIIRRWHKSYMEHMHRLHPFLAPQDLYNKVEQFIKAYCPPKPPVFAAPRPPPAGSSNSVGDLPRESKRKRSSETLTTGAGFESHGSPDGKADLLASGHRRIAWTVQNAIMLFVLSLGSICEYRDLPLPGPIRDKPVDFRTEYIPGPTYLPGMSPVGSESAYMPPQNKLYLPGNTSYPSPPIVHPVKNTAARPAMGPHPLYLRNADVIPGLALYAYANQIMSNLQGANLANVQASLLASLYAGQLAHPFLSHTWIYQAARACQILVRPKRYDQLREGYQKDLTHFAYWTCLQLESDILAELDLPASGISRSEGRIELPQGRYSLSLPSEICESSNMMMFYYSAQIHLRKVLNRVHTDLYKAPKQGENKWSTSVQGVLSMNLDLWRTSLPESMQWKDSDPPADEINVARMRAKYYGAKYIIYRPLLYRALHLVRKSDSKRKDDKLNSESPARAPLQTDKERWNVPSPGEETVTVHDLPPSLRRACMVCINSAILSTKAFDGLKGRPVVTNIFGTAHAQFGNMLVLSATYMSSLSDLVDRETLEKLLRRTITFLLQYRNISPTLRADAQILDEIYQKIFGEPPSSFSAV